MSIDGMLAMLARQGMALSQIAANTYVAPPESESEPTQAPRPTERGPASPSPGLLAGLADPDGIDRGPAVPGSSTPPDRATAQALAAGVGQDAAVPEPPASQSLAGLRLPRTADATPGADSTRTGDGPDVASTGPGLRSGDVQATNPPERPRVDAGAPADAVGDVIDTSPDIAHRAAAAPTAPGIPMALRADAGPEAHAGSEPEAALAAGTPPGSRRAADRPASSPEAGHARGDLRSADPEARPSERVRGDAPAAAALAAGAADGFSPVPGTDGAPQVERAGIIASFVLNAAMIPGWPPPRPFAPPSAEALLGVLARAAPPGDDAAVLAFLKRRGAKPTLLARLRALAAKLVKSRRLGVLLGLTALMSAIEEVLDAVDEELGRLARREDEDAEDADAAWRRISV